MGKDSPDPPDPAKVSREQTKSNIATAREQSRLNALDVFSPYGSSQFMFDPNTNLPIAQVNELSPELQGVFESQTAAQQGLADQTGSFLAGLPQAGGFSLGDIPGTDDIAETSYESRVAQMRPDFEDARENIEIRMAERGIAPGSSIWEDEMNRFERARNETFSQASRQADLDAGQEFQRLLGNRVTERGLPFQELSQVMGLQTGMPQVQSGPVPQSQVANTDVSGNVWNAYKAQQQQAQAGNEGLFGLASAIGGPIASEAAGPIVAALSDERTKENRKPADGETILAKFRDMPVDSFNYKPEARAAFDVPESRVSPMAQDYAEKFGGNESTIDLTDMMGRILSSLQALDARTQDRARA